VKLIDLFLEGGFIMYPLLICSLLTWAVAFEKMKSLKNFKQEFRKLHERALQLVRNNKIDEAKGLFSSADHLIASPHLELFSSRDLPRDIRDERVHRRLKETQMGLKKFLWILGTIGSSAPFIGLFGTVVGIIKSFEAMASTGKGGFTVVAAGLSEALIATAAGIIIAVIAVLFFNYFQTKLSEINIEFKHGLEDLSDFLNQ